MEIELITSTLVHSWFLFKRLRKDGWWSWPWRNLKSKRSVIRYTAKLGVLTILFLCYPQRSIHIVDKQGHAMWPCQLLQSILVCDWHLISRHWKVERKTLPRWNFIRERSDRRNTAGNFDRRITVLPDHISQSICH